VDGADGRTYVHVRTDGRLRPTLLGRLRGVDLQKDNNIRLEDELRRGCLRHVDGQLLLLLLCAFTSPLSSTIEQRHFQPSEAAVGKATLQLYGQLLTM